MLWGALLFGWVWGAETDQYWGRWIALQDSVSIINKEVNSKLKEALASYDGPYRDGRALAKTVRWELEGVFNYRRFFKWVEKNPSIDKLETRGKGIWTHLSPWISIIQHSPHEASTVNLGGVRLGTDKFSHFFEHGYSCFEEYLEGGEEACVEYSHYTEDVWYGKVTTGVFSNADMVANWEGYRFYRNLLQPMGDLEPLVTWDSLGPYLNRPFDLMDHVNAYWDEALNASQFRKSVGEHFVKEVTKLCSWHHQDPTLYTMDLFEDQALEERYKILRLDNHRQHRMENLCD